jgi:hypothetical protein
MAFFKTVFNKSYNIARVFHRIQNIFNSILDNFMEFHHFISFLRGHNFLDIFRRSFSCVIFPLMFDQTQDKTKLYKKSSDLKNVF